MGYGFGNRIAVGRRAITAQAQAEQVIWKVAIFGAGTTSSNGEYIWNGSGTINGKNVYSAGGNDIFWNGFNWNLYDDAAGTFYNSDDLINWTIPEDEAGQEPAPSSALSYAQNSFINGFELDGDVSQTYSRISGGNTTFTSGEPEYYVAVDGESWFAFNENISGEELYASYNGGFTWEQVAGDLPVPNISAITYSA